MDNLGVIKVDDPSMYDVGSPIQILGKIYKVVFIEGNYITLRWPAKWSKV